MVGLTGGGILLWVFQRPKVELLSVREAAWYYLYKDGEHIISTELIVSVSLRNKGTEDTNVSVTFETKINEKPVFFTSSDSIELRGRGMRKEARVYLVLPKEEGYPKDNTELTGVLRLEVWGNKRLFLGNDRLEENIIASCGQNKRLEKSF